MINTRPRRPCSLASNGIGIAGATKLADALCVNRTLCHLVLRDNGIGPEGATRFGRALRTNQGLQHLDLTGNAIGDAGAVAIGDAVQANTVLIRLVLANNCIRDAGAASLGAGLRRNTTLLHVDLDHNPTTAFSIEELAVALLDNSTVIELCFHGQNARTDSAQSIEGSLASNRVRRAVNAALQLAHTKCINLDRIGVDDKHMAEICAALRRSVNVARVTLNDSNVGDPGVEKLCLALALCTRNHVIALSLERAAFTLAGTRNIADLLRSTIALRELMLSGNDLGGAAGVSYLADALSVNTTVRCMGLGGCHVTDVGVMRLARVLRSNSPLCDLSLRDNSIGPAGAVELSNALQMSGRVMHLNMCNNHIGDEGASSFGLALRANTLSRLILAENGIGDTGVHQLADALRKTTVTTHLDLDANLGISDSGVTALSIALLVNASVAEVRVYGENVVSDERTAINIPKNFARIPQFAFAGSKITSISLPSTVVAIGSNAFEECTALKSIHFAELNGITEIPSEAFAGCTALTELIVPRGVTTIGPHAFQGCAALCTLTIPGTVVEISTGSFAMCRMLTEVAIPASVRTVGDSAWQGCVGLKSVSIPTGVNVGANMLSQCTSLERVEIDVMSAILRAPSATMFEDCSPALRLCVSGYAFRVLSGDEHDVVVSWPPLPDVNSDFLVDLNSMVAEQHPMLCGKPTVKDGFELYGNANGNLVQLNTAAGMRLLHAGTIPPREIILQFLW